jgi:hypothetical protein
VDGGEGHKIFEMVGGAMREKQDVSSTSMSRTGWDERRASLWGLVGDRGIKDQTTMQVCPVRAVCIPRSHHESREVVVSRTSLWKLKS